MPMWWKDQEPFENPEFKFNDEQFAHYQRAIAIRNKLPALRTGFFRPILIDDARGVYAFARELGDERVHVIVNRSAKRVSVEVPIEGPGSYLDWMSPQQATVTESNDARPAVSAKSGAAAVTPSNGKIALQLAPYQRAVWARQ
jgi:hypothetical protein